MTPEQLERDIAHQLAECDRFYTASKRYAADGYPSLAADYRRMASQAARNAAALAAQRTPETVARIAGVSFLATVPAAFLQAQNETRR